MSPPHRTSLASRAGLHERAPSKGPQISAANYSALAGAYRMAVGLVTFALAPLAPFVTVLVFVLLPYKAARH
eukprot:scaffold42586_cov19-Tisochrysis_lutea.AAC.1